MERERALRVRKAILDALVEVVAERGFVDTSVALVVARAKVSNRAFYEQFSDLRECFAEVLDLGLSLPAELIAGAFVQEQNWRDGVLAALAELLVFLDAEPALTRIWFGEVMAVGSWALEHREHNIAAMQALIVEHWLSEGSSQADPVLVRGVMSSILAVLTTHVVTRRREPMVTLLGPLMSLIVTPFLDADAARMQVKRAEALAAKLLAERPAPARAARGAAAGVGVVPDGLLLPRAHRARRCLHYLAEQHKRQPGRSNREIGEAIGVTHPGQTSKLLARLTRLGLLAKHPGAPGRPNAWTLTPEGARVAGVLKEYE